MRIGAVIKTPVNLNGVKILPVISPTAETTKEIGMKDKMRRLMIEK